MTDTIRQTIIEEISGVLKDAGKQIPEVNESTSLLDGGMGMDSLDFAVLVVRLEQRLGSDPFNSATLDRFPTTLGALVSVYQNAAAAKESQRLP
ncbi:MAG: acyl carrier protein [Verrucomicrobiales bacterium]